MRSPGRAAPGSWPAAAVREACAALEIVPGEARVLRLGHCAVVALPAAGLVARVGRPGYSPERLDAELRIARHLARAGLPVLAPADAVRTRPIATGHGPVTFWPLVDHIGGDLDWAWLAHTLRRLHELPLPAELVSLWDPVGRVEERVALYASHVTARGDYVSLLSTACDEARAVLTRLRSALGIGLVHGDPLNVVLTARGPLLLDFDLAGVGPAEWDLVSVAIRQRRFGLPVEELLGFCAAYGFDLLSWEHFEVLLRVRELLDCSFALAVSEDHPGATRQIEVRVRAWLDPADRSAWTPLR